MSGSMRNWIGPLVECELNGALTSFEGNYVPGQTVEDGHRVCGPDVVSVNIKKAQEVQLIEFNGRNVHPYEATVSDGTKYIRATFDRQATELFAKTNGRDFCDVRGGVIALLNFNISKVPRKLSLEVVQFIFRGSEGSKVFGKPSDVFKNENIQTLLVRLEGLLDGNGDENETLSQPPSPVRSQVDWVASGESQSSGNSGSQAGFATQIPAIQERTSTKAVDVEGSKAGKLTDLLGLLRSKIVRPLGQEDQKLTKSIGSVQALTATSNTVKKTILTPVAGERVLEMTSRLEAKANEKSQAFSSSQVQASDPKSQPILIDGARAQSIRFLLSDDSEKENSQESLNSGRPTPNSAKIGPIEKADTEQAIPELCFIDHFQVETPFEGLKRVPRRYVRISESQQALLESNDSWYEPPNDSRSGYATIPSKVRDDLNTYLQKKPLSKKPSQGIQESEVDSEESADDENTLQSFRMYESEGPEQEEELSLVAIANDSKGKAPLTRVQTTPSNSSERPSDEEEEWTPSPHQQRTRTVADDVEKIHISSSHNGWDGSPQLSETVQNPCQFATQTEKEMFADMRASDASEPGSSLPARRDNRERPGQQSIRRLRTPVLIPSSDPAEEEELEFAVPYAVGEVVEEDNAEAHEASEAFQERPPTVLPSLKTVQVEHTPFPQSRRLHRWPLKSKQADESLGEFKEGDDIVSSDPRIPATCDTSNAISSSSGEAAGRVSQVKLALPVEDQSGGATHPSRVHAQFSLDEPDENEAQKQLSENSQRDRNALSSRVHGTLSTGRSPERPSPQARVVAASPPWNMAVDNHLVEQHSSPPVAPSSKKDIDPFEQSSPATIGSRKRAVDGCGSSPMPSKRRRRIASMIMQEETPARDPKEMARANRHLFRTRLTSAAKSIDYISPRHSPPNCQKRGEIIPSTNPRAPSGEAPLPDAQMQSSSTDGMHHVPATFEEPNSILKGDSLDEAGTLKQPAKDDLYLSATSPAQDAETSLPPGAEASSALLRTSVFPLTEPDPHTQLDSYNEFMYAYPEYQGSKKKFTWALVYIEWLREGRQYLHKTLCDDFIRILASDFEDYIRQCSKTGETPMSGWEFFHGQNMDPLFDHEIITPGNLQRAIASLDGETVTMYREKFHGPAQATENQNSEAQQSTMAVASTQPLSSIEGQDGLFLEDASLEDFQESESPSNNREGGLELRSPNSSTSSFNPPKSQRPASVSSRQEPSPELGLEKGSSSRKGFFETYSQLPSAQHPAETTPSRASGVTDLTSRIKRRSLPWAGRSATALSSKLNFHTDSPMSTPADRDAFKKPSLPAPRINSPLTKEGDLKKASGWFDEKKFKFYAKKRAKRVSMEARSNAGTPTSTSNLRRSFQGTPSKGSARRVEPETQAWES